jgi:DNA repair exonuclease SbcCD ATPase subunit
MRIIQLVAENIKKLTAIDITPTDSMVMVTGPNGAGKSSILDSIVMGLCGGRSIPELPIKKGADKGKIMIDLGDYTITRSFTPTSSYLKIENKDGSNVTSPQKFLDKIVGNISFDPLDFLNNEKKKQRDILLQLLGVNVDEIDKQEKDLREQRTIVGRDSDKAQALYKSITSYPDIHDTTEVSVSSLSTKLREAMDYNANLSQEIQSNENIKELAKKDIERMTAIDEQIATLVAEKSTLSQAVADKKVLYQTTKAKLSEAAVLDTADISLAMENAESTNQKIRANIQKSEAQARYQEHKDQYDSLTQQIDDIATQRKSLLSSATMPVDGLSFDEGGLLYNSIPLDQASDGEKLMVSLGISMALNPTLRVLRIKDGSLLDQRNRDIIKATIKDKDFQLFFESVSSDSKVGIFIEEGEIKAIDGVPVTPKVKKSTPTTKSPEPPTPKPATSSSGEDW